MYLVKESDSVTTIMYLYICYFAGYPYGGIFYSILGPNIPFLLLAILALMLLLTQVFITQDVLFYQPTADL